MFKRKFVINMIFCACGVFAVALVFLFIYKGADVNTSAYKWESLDFYDDWDCWDQISLASGISLMQIDELPTSLSISIQNNSSVDVDFLFESITLQKMNESGQWLTWSLVTDSEQVGAEIQRSLSPGNSIEYNAKLSDLVPEVLLTAGNYRLFLPFSYRTSDANVTGGSIEISYGYTVSEIKIQ